jgi:seryl-tRNA synthetase
MLDPAYILTHVAQVKENCQQRGVSSVPVDEVVRLEQQRKELTRQRGELAARKNEISKRFPQAQTADEKQTLKGQSQQLDAQLQQLDRQLKQVEEELQAQLRLIPNLTHPAAPIGIDASANVVLRQVGQKRAFDFPPRDHVALCEILHLADFEAGAKVAGQKFYYLTHDGALLELALVQYALRQAMQRGYIPIITPDLARTEVLEGIGFLPRDPNPNTRQIYTIADSDLCLIATAEITLGGLHKDEIFDEEDLPRRYVGLSHCFRTEAGAAGRETRGLYRVHQFTKVELFAFTVPEQSEAMHEEIRQLEEEIFQGLGIPYQVVDTCTGDLGGPAYRKYDLEAWMPGRGTHGEYGEVTSTSNCTDYQARRLNIRYKSKQFKGTRFVHTLNGTAIACTRAMIALLENYQQADGSVVVPEVLRPFLGKDRLTPPPQPLRHGK